MSTVVAVLEVNVSLADEVIAADQVPVEDAHLERRVMRKRRLNLETSVPQTEPGMVFFNRNSTTIVAY